MMSRRITLTIAAAILTLVGLGVLAFALTTNEPQASAPDAAAIPAAATAVPGPTAAARATESTISAEVPVPTSPAGTTGQPAPTATSVEPPASATTEPATPQPIEQAIESTVSIDGGQLYATHCASCHGVSGQGGTGGAVDEIDMTLASVIEITIDGVPRMPAFSGTLTPEEIEAVAEYTLSLSQ